MRIAVVGAGAIVGFIAATLARSGQDVAVVARGAHLDAIAHDGLTLVASDLGPFTARVRASDDLRSLGSFDVVMLAFKAHQWPELLPQLRSLAHTDTTIVTLQNGVPFWYVRRPPLQTVDPGGRIGALFDDECIVGGVVHVSGHLVAPGRIHQSGGTRYALGAPGGGSSARVRNVVAAMNDAGLLQAALDPNVRETVWLKLVNNSALNPTSTLHRLTIRPLLERVETRAEVYALMQETLRVGQALGVVREVDLDARIAYAQRLGDVKTSMFQDFEAGRTLELDPIVGAVVELGDRLGIDVPHLRDVYTRLRTLAPA